MANTPELTKPSSAMPYVWAAVIIFLLGVVLVGLVLFLRPTYDPLLVITAVMGFITTLTASIFAVMKGQETHLTVNSQLTAWKAEFSALRLAEGKLEGTATEQSRVAEMKRVGALTGSDTGVISADNSPAASPAASPAVPVIVTNPTPVKVTETKHGS